MALRRVLFLLLLGGIGAFFLRKFCFETIYIASESMAPTFPTGTKLIVNKFSPQIRPPHRGEVVMFKKDGLPHEELVKRVIAISGDEIEIREKKVFLNGDVLEEPYAEFKRVDEILKGDNIPPTKIPDGHVFVMGDNRDFSRDSRDWRDQNNQWDPFLSIDSITGFVLHF